MPSPKDPKEPTSAKASAGEEDKVAAAYENISKKLESLRSGEEVEDEEDGDEAAERRSDESKSDEELEEWKGPKPMKNPEIPEGEDEDDMELRRVKLKNLEGEEDQESDEAAERRRDEENDEEEDDDDDEVSKEGKVSRVSDGEELEENDKKPKREWEPKENDPLDEEEEDSDEAAERRSDEKIDDDEEEEEDAELPIHKTPAEDEEAVISSRTKFSDVENEAEIPVKRDPQPDTLDDLADESASAKVSSDEEDDYFIPNLKGSGQRAGSMEYNTPIERESYGESYQKSSMDNDPNNYFSQHSQPQPAKRANKFHLLILVAIGVVVIGFTVYILKGGFGDISLTSQPSPSPSPVESPSPTPTPTPEPERSQYKIRVLNGSGKTGLAASVSAKLKELGYQVDKTGNATNSAFTQTVVRVKTENEPLIPQIVKDLLPDFDASGTTGLKDDDTVDIEIILGAK